MEEKDTTMVYRHYCGSDFNHQVQLVQLMPTIRLRFLHGFCPSSCGKYFHHSNQFILKDPEVAAKEWGKKTQDLQPSACKLTNQCKPLQFANRKNTSSKGFMVHLIAMCISNLSQRKVLTLPELRGFGGVISLLTTIWGDLG